MKVGIDISKLHSLSKNRGIGVATKLLIEALKEYTDIEVRVIEGEKSNHEGLDLVHYPYFDFFRPTLPFKKVLPTVVTIHDVTPLVFPKHYPAGIKGRINLERQKLALRGVDAVVTDSDYSKKDIVKYLKVDLNKIVSIYLAPSKQYQIINDQKKLETIKEKFDLPDKFALYTGNVNWNKNILGLTKACLEEDMDLILVGKSFTEKENLNHPELKSFKEFIKSYENNPKIHILGFVENDDLVDILNLATFFIFPSYYEGFGLPILEAQACGVPVITSNTSSMPEVAGEGAILVDPYNVADIKQAIKKIIDDKKGMETLRKKGLENVEKFSWEKVAKQTAQVYANILR